MENPKIKTKVVHSESKLAWNVVGTKLGAKWKIARVPYILTGDPDVNKREVDEAFNHAKFISECFNNSDLICSVLESIKTPR